MDSGHHLRGLRYVQGHHPVMTVGQEDKMISTQSASFIHDVAHLLGDLEEDPKADLRGRPLLKDIRAVRRDLDALEREVLEVSEHVGLRGDAC